MYKIRFKCQTDPNDWHYEYLDQTAVDENVTCSQHPTAEVKYFVVLHEETT